MLLSRVEVVEGWERLKFIHFRRVYTLQLTGMKGSAPGATSPRLCSRKGAGKLLPHCTCCFCI